LGIFPKHSINIVTPNIYELKAMYNAAQENGHFDSLEWWKTLDSFKITSQFRQGRFPPEICAETDVEILLRKANPGHDSDRRSESPESKSDTSLLDLIVEGSIQQAIALLPYIPNILIKLGPRGVLCVRLAPKAFETNNNDINELRLQGVKVDVVVRYFPGLKHQGIVSVTGAGYVFSRSELIQ
jgi:pseudouridine-5'-phosphate glycosidase/pseudouridine kinase